MRHARPRAPPSAIASLRAVGPVPHVPGAVRLRTTDVPPTWHEALDKV
jgi:hypothetical protein